MTPGMPYMDYETRDPVGASLEDIARLTGFTREDLAENRQGKISPRQLVRLFGRALHPIRYTGSAFLGWVLLCLLVEYVPGLSFVASLLWLFGIASTRFLLIPTAICGVLLLFSILSSASRVVRLLVDLSDGQTAYKEGRISATYEERKDRSLAQYWGSRNHNRQCWYVVGGEYFEVDDRAYSLDPSGRYRLYHTPRSKLLLSMEPVESRPAA